MAITSRALVAANCELVLTLLAHRYPDAGDGQKTAREKSIEILQQEGRVFINGYPPAEAQGSILEYELPREGGDIHRGHQRAADNGGHPGNRPVLYQEDGFFLVPQTDHTSLFLVAWFGDRPTASGAGAAGSGIISAPVDPEVGAGFCGRDESAGASAGAQGDGQAGVATCRTTWW